MPVIDPDQPPAWEDVSEQFTSAFPGLDAGEMQRRYEQARQLGRTRERYRFGDLSVEQPAGTVNYLVRHSTPFVSSVGGAIDDRVYGRARQRFAAGNPEPVDYHTIARYERERGVDQDLQSTTLGQMGHALAHVPALVGEMALTGGLGAGASAGAEAPSLLSRAGLAAAGRAAVSPGTYGRLALRTAVTPSLYTQEWTQRNLEAGRDALDWHGMPPALAHGMLMHAVFGSLGATGESITGRGVLPTAQRLLARTGQGVVGQEAIQLMSGAASDALGDTFARDGRYGFLGRAARGQWGDAWRQLAVDGVTMAAFAGFHEIQQGDPGPRLRERQVREARERTLTYLNEHFGRAAEQAGPGGVPDPALAGQARQRILQGMTEAGLPQPPQAPEPAPQTQPAAPAPQTQPAVPPTPREQVDQLGQAHIEALRRAADAAREERAARQDLMAAGLGPGGAGRRQTAQTRLEGAQEAGRRARADAEGLVRQLDRARVEAAAQEPPAETAATQTAPAAPPAPPESQGAPDPSPAAPAAPAGQPEAPQAPLTPSQQTALEIQQGLAGFGEGVRAGSRAKAQEYARRVVAGEPMERVLEGKQRGGAMWQAVEAEVAALRGPQAPARTPQEQEAWERMHRSRDFPGVGNRLAFDEAGPSPAVAVTDLDRAGQMGRERAGQALQGKIDAMRASGAEPYHIGSDEFLARGESAEALRSRLEAARATLQSSHGADFSYGVGATPEQAAEAMRQHKADRANGRMSAEELHQRLLSGGAVPGLSAGQAADLRAHVVEGRTLEDIGRGRGVSREAVRQSVENAAQQLHARVAEPPPRTVAERSARLQAEPGELELVRDVHRRYEEALDQLQEQMAREIEEHGELSPERVDFYLRESAALDDEQSAGRGAGPALARALARGRGALRQPGGLEPPPVQRGAGGALPPGAALPEAAAQGAGAAPAVGAEAAAAPAKAAGAGGGGREGAAAAAAGAEAPGDVLELARAVRRIGGAGGLADLLDLRKEMGEGKRSGWSRGRFDRAFLEARRQGLLSGESREGRHGITAEQLGADVEDVPGERRTRIGFATLREEGLRATDPGQARPPDVSDLYDTVPAATARRMERIHASGDATAWEDAREALRRNYPHTAEAVIDALGRQRRTSASARTPLGERGVHAQLAGEYRKHLEDREMEHERNQHAAEAARQAGDSVADVASTREEFLQAGETAGQAEDLFGEPLPESEREQGKLFGFGPPEEGELAYGLSRRADPTYRPNEPGPARPASAELAGPEGAEPGEFDFGANEPGGGRGFGQPLTAEERARGEIAGGQEETRREPSRPLHETALANAVAQSERATRMESPLEAAARQDNPTTWARGGELLARNADAGKDLVAELNRRPRPVTPEEGGLLLRWKIALRNEYARVGTALIANRRGQLALDAVDRAALERQQDALYEQTGQLDRAVHATGTQLGRSLQFRRQLAAEDFSLGGMLMRAELAKGEPLTPEERERVQGQQRRIEETGRAAEAAEEPVGALASAGPPGETQAEAGRRVATSEEFRTLQRRQGEAEGEREGFRRDLASWQRDKLPWADRWLDWLTRLRRAFVLSGPQTVAKLAAAGQEQMLLTPLQDVIGSALRQIPGLSRIMALAPREGGRFSATAEGRAWGAAYTDGIKDAWQTVRTGTSELQLLHGDQRTQPRDWIDMVGELHAALKAPVKRAEFTRSLLRRIEQGAAQGRDVTSPAALAEMGAQAYQDANRAIFMEDNAVAQLWTRATASLTRPEASGGAKTVGYLMKAALPVVRVPTNIVAQTLEYAFGSVTGSVRAAAVLRRGVEGLPPAQADVIARQLKRGSLGAAVLALGYAAPKLVGGFYSGKRDPNDVEAGAVGGVPRVLLHHPLFEALAMGATFRRAIDGSRGRAGESLPGGVAAGMGGLLGELPHAREARELSHMFSPDARERGRAFGELAKSLAVPQLFQWAAGRLDTTTGGVTAPSVRRRPQGLLQNVQTGVPLLRNQVPAAR